jgi:hypothetical protein|tara:strand:+ start:1562 stop:2272 length:711 start_codon:yes stop_codon:yes gene_type:complete
MTLLTIATAVADEVGISRPASVVGSAAADAQKLLRYVNKSGWALMKSTAWQVLRKERTFTSIGGATQTSILPADFDRFIPETFWNRTDYELISGPVSPVEWQGMKAFSYGGDDKFTYRGDDILILPEPGAGKALAFEYISTHWCKNSAGAGGIAMAADTDVGIIDEELLVKATKFTFLSDEGLPNDVAYKEMTDYADDLVRNDQASPGILVAADIFGGGRHFAGVPAVSGSRITSI